MGRRQWAGLSSPFLMVRLSALARFGLITALLALGYDAPARADWGLAGAQYLCDSKHGLFELLPFDRSSDDPPGGISPEPGYKEIPQKAAPFNCSLGTFSLHVAVEVYPPSNGQGMAAGAVRARSLSISDVEFLPDSPLFDWSGDFDRSILSRIRLTVVNPGTVKLERCYSNSSKPATSEHCGSKEIPFAALAKAQAEAHRLADRKFQEEHSAARVPPELDYANAFVGHDRGRAPVCAHLSSSFLRGLEGSAPIVRSARIAGTEGERVYIWPANPQVCDVSAEPKCRIRAYLFPGDRVDVGFICGPWTYISYGPLTRATGPTYGWVRTVDLYDVDLHISSHLNKEFPQPASASEDLAASTLPWLARYERISYNETNAEFSGEWKPVHDLPALVQHELDVGARIDEPDKRGETALIATFVSNNFDVARVLLKAGAKPNLIVNGTSPLMLAMGYYPNHHDLTIIALLLEAGADPNFRTDGEFYERDDGAEWSMAVPGYGQTALTIAAAAGELALVQTLLSHGADPSIPRSDGALPASIARSKHHGDVAELIEHSVHSRPSHERSIE